MFGNLAPIQMEELLQKQLIGRIGCSHNGQTYVVPISYVYKDNAIYCHTREGKKMEMMRANPQVCFEVDGMKDMAHWQSVIVQGVFEELTDTEDRLLAMDYLLSRYLPVVSSQTTHIGAHWPFHPKDEHEVKGIFFRILVKEKTGRYESASESPYIPG